MAIDIKRLQAFVAVADSGTYEEAATSLDRPQPTVWRQVEQLQTDLGGLKLVRGGRPLQLTPAGEQFLPMARRLIQDNEDLQRLALDLRDGVSGVLKIACYPAHVNRFIAEISAAFKKRFPKTRIELAPYSQAGTAGQELIDKLIDGHVDLAVAQRRPGDPSPERDGMKGRLIYKVRLVVVLPDDHPLRHEATIKPEALRDESLLLPPEGYFTRVQVEGVFREADIVPSVAAESGAWMALVAMGRTGIGIPIVPDDALEVGLVYPALVDGSGEELLKELWLVWRTQDWQNPTLTSFLEYVDAFCLEQGL